MRKIVLATRNKGKILEIKELLVGLPLEIIGLEHYHDFPTIAETGVTFQENAVLKARITAQFAHELALADDSGLEVESLNGEPGVYSARYGDPGWDDHRRYQYLLEKMADIPQNKRNARFRCIVAVYDPLNGLIATGEGKIAGVILTKPKGTNGFGYDPVFYLPEKGCTMAELSEAEKNQISHRGLAIRSIIPKLNEIL